MEEPQHDRVGETRDARQSRGAGKQVSRLPQDVWPIIGGGGRWLPHATTTFHQWTGRYKGKRPIPANSDPRRPALRPGLLPSLRGVTSDGRPRLSVVVLNYNGARWLDRCLASFRAQTIAADCELILVDNASPDGSGRQAAELVAGRRNERFQQNGANLGFCGGNNQGAKTAQGEYLFFLNNDTWLEPDCLACLLAEVTRCGATAAMPRVLNYADNTIQCFGFDGLDPMGLPVLSPDFAVTRELFIPYGCAFLIRRDAFERVGGFDEQLFMYTDEMDLALKVWLSGGSAIGVPAARLHHQGAANVNPAELGQPVSIRTSETTRYYCNRNSLLQILKFGQHLVLLLAIVQLAMLVAEGFVGLLLVRRWSFIRRAYWDAVRDVWRLRGHVLAERRHFSTLRKRGDLWLLRRFGTLRLNRWKQLQVFRRHGLPKIVPR